MNRSDAEKLISDCIAKLKEEFDELDSIALHNQEKVLDAFRKNAVQARHFAGSTGYGYDDAGRDTLACVFADALGAESAVVSPMITAGTQALSLMLFGVLRPGDLFISVSGKPYDTLTDVISGENCGSLKEFGVDFDVIDLKFDGLTPKFDFAAIETALTTRKVKAIFVGRSRGYEWRSAISVEAVGEMIKFVKKLCPDTLVLVDNCYGEFVERIEPTDVGADLIAGSLIKNIGGGIAPTGGYIAGKKNLVELVGKHLTALAEYDKALAHISYYIFKLLTAFRKLFYLFRNPLVLLFHTAQKRRKLVIRLIGKRIVEVKTVYRLYDRARKQSREKHGNDKNRRYHKKYPRQRVSDYSYNAFCGARDTKNTAVVKTQSIIVCRFAERIGKALGRALSLFDSLGYLRPSEMVVKRFFIGVAVKQHVAVICDMGYPVFGIICYRGQVRVSAVSRKPVQCLGYEDRLRFYLVFVFAP